MKCHMIINICHQPVMPQGMLMFPAIYYLYRHSSMFDYLS